MQRLTSFGPAAAAAAAADAPAAATAGAEYAFRARADLRGVGDYSCNYKEQAAGGAEMPFCFVPGGLNTAADACNDDSRCVSFVAGSRSGVPGAYLKSAAAPASTNSDTSLYQKRSGIPAYVGELSACELSVLSTRCNHS